MPLTHYVRYVELRAVLGALPALALLLCFRMGLGVHSVSVSSRRASP